MNGILVQLPLPPQIDADLVTERIDPLKDVDGFHPYNIGRLVLKRPTLRPCTPYGCMTLLKDTGEDLVGKHAVVIGQSNIVGRPMALELLMERCTVTICHSKTRDLPGLVRQADIVVAGIGKANFVQGAWLKPGAMVIDVGINRNAEGKLCGDVDFDDGEGGGLVDHAGAGWRRADDHRDAARQHAARGGAAGRRGTDGRLTVAAEVQDFEGAKVSIRPLRPAIASARARICGVACPPSRASRRDGARRRDSARRRPKCGNGRPSRAPRSGLRYVAPSR